MVGTFDVELGRILSDYEKGSGAVDPASARELFRQRFRDVRKSTLVPALESISASLAARGVRSKLQTEKELLDSGSEPIVSLLLLIDMTKSDGMSFDRTNFSRQHPDSKYPFLSVHADSGSGRVVITRSTSAPGFAGTRQEEGALELDAVSEGLLQQKVLEILKEIYAGARR
jgi:hypothetical protein